MSTGPVDAYLDNLFAQLRGNDPRDARSILSEAETHLRDAAEEATKHGMSPEDAEADAVRRFGEARLVAKADCTRNSSYMARGIGVAAWWLGAWGAVAVGISGLLAGAMRLAGGTDRFLAGPWASDLATRSDCDRWLRAYPHARSCAQAALADWANEIVWYRIALGVLGVSALVVLWLARRHFFAGFRWAPLPATVVDTIATTLFGVGGVSLAVVGLDKWVVHSGHGSGQWLSAAPVALAAAGVFSMRLLKDLHAAD